MLVIEIETTEAKQLVRGIRTNAIFNTLAWKSWETEIPSCGQILGSELSAKV